ncbi:MAG: hypothetical protein U0075_16480 [Thermomicrobiales bacterium]
MVLPPGSFAIAVQALGEHFTIVVHESRRSRVDADHGLTRHIRDHPADSRDDIGGGDLVAVHQISPRDAVILSVASQARCRLLLSGELRDEFTWGDLAFGNPFTAPRHVFVYPLLGEKFSTDSSDRGALLNFTLC